MTSPKDPQPQPEMLGDSPRPNLSPSEIAFYFDVQNAPVCIVPAMSISVNNFGGYELTCTFSTTATPQWTSSNDPNVLIESSWGSTASDSDSQMDVNELSGSLTCGFSGNVAWGDSSVIVTLSAKADQNFEMSFMGIDAKSSSGTIVDTLVVYTYSYSSAGNGGFNVTVTGPVITETGQPLSPNAMCPCPMTTDQVTALQQQARDALVALGNGVQNSLTVMCEGYGGPFGG